MTLSDLFLDVFRSLWAHKLRLLVVGAVSGLVPAMRASKLDPVEALRYE